MEEKLIHEINSKFICHVSFTISQVGVAFSKDVLTSDAGYNNHGAYGSFKVFVNLRSPDDFGFFVESFTDGLNDLS